MLVKNTILFMVKRQYKLLFIVIVASLILFAQPHETYLVFCTKKDHVLPENPHTITIWVHGTLFSQKLLQKLYQLIQGPFYALYGKKLPFFHIDAGLQRADTLSEHSYSHTIINTLQKAYQQSCQADSIEKYYIFGWSGKLRVADREAGGKELYHALKSIQLEYQKKYGVNPYIRVITHSHGGNVALYMAKYAPTDDPVRVHELILLACPVQEHTASYIFHPLFERIYSLYSDRDIIQRLDPQKLHRNPPGTSIPLFSQRHFPHAQKIDQVQIIMNGKHLWHVDFMLPFFLKQLPHIINHISSWFAKEPLSTYKKRDLRMYTKLHLLKRHMRRLKKKGLSHALFC